jgi:hypothetical protein
MAQRQNQIGWQQFSDHIRNGGNDQNNHSAGKEEQDMDQVQTPRLKRKERQSRTEFKFILNAGNSPSTPIKESEQPPQPQGFQAPKKAKTRAERRAEEDLIQEDLTQPISITKRQRRSDYWVVQDTQRMNRSRRLKELETVRSLSFDDVEIN